jgi:hypothetical protein
MTHSIVDDDGELTINRSIDRDLFWEINLGRRRPNFDWWYDNTMNWQMFNNIIIDFIKYNYNFFYL